jgi:hypothetical protein
MTNIQGDVFFLSLSFGFLRSDAASSYNTTKPLSYVVMLIAFTFGLFTKASNLAMTFIFFAWV